MMSLAANLSYLLSMLVTPYMPEVAETIQMQLNLVGSRRVLDQHFVQYLPEGHQLNEVDFFPQIYLPL